MSRIYIQKISITDLSVDAIVNAANDGLWVGGGVCGAIFKAAGLAKLQEACNKIGHCDTGSAVITPGFDLEAKYIIHAVGPQWNGGQHNEPKLLYGAYRSSLELAMNNECHSIGFPLISAGIFGYPLGGAWRKAIQACDDFLKKHSDYDLDIIFAVLDDAIMQKGIETLSEIVPDNDIVKQSDWRTYPMPESHDSFTLERSFTSEQMNILRKGHIPEEMEDKWFWYMEDNFLYAYRSWTGFCIYCIEFSQNGQHKVTVNRDNEQYGCTSIDEDRKILNKLLNWWAKTNYDHYGEWLSEIVDIDTLSIDGNNKPAVYFHDPDKEYGFLSNWYMSSFELDGVTYSSMEQYIMYQKCILFGDTETAKQIINTDDVEKAKMMGRTAKGYNNTVWSGIRQVIAYRGLLAKFEQNPDLKQKLLDTGDAYLVECAYSDKIWACGVHIDDGDRRDMSKWKGQNILGFALMEVRKELKK